jgi:hypothetical protein
VRHVASVLPTATSSISISGRCLRTRSVRTVWRAVGSVTRLSDAFQISAAPSDNASWKTPPA